MRCDFCSNEYDKTYTINTTAYRWTDNDTLKLVILDFVKKYPGFRSGRVCENCYTKRKIKGLLV